MKQKELPQGFMLLLVAVCVVTACAPEQQKPAPLPLRAVYVHQVAPPQETITRSFSGVIESAEGVGLGFEVSGRIIEIPVKEGRRYQKGELLARLDDTGFRADMNNAQAQFAAADADMQRALRLFESRNASKSQLDAAMAARETAKANLDIASKRLRDCRLRMPYSGVIGHVDGDNQQVINAGQSVVTIQGEGGLHLEVGVPADVIQSIEVDQIATVRLGSISGHRYRAQVTEVSPQIAGNTTYPVKLTLEDPGPEVREGMDGEAEIEIPGTGGLVLVVPLSCVATSPDGKSFVWAVDGVEDDRATVSRQYVRTGELRDHGQIEILDGLQAGESIVSRGVHRLQEGLRVRLSSARAQ